MIVYFMSRRAFKDVTTFTLSIVMAVHVFLSMCCKVTGGELQFTFTRDIQYAYID